MQAKKSFKSFLAVLLTAVMLMTVMAPMTVMAKFTVDSTKLGEDLYLTSKTDYTVAPGITETQITTNNGAGNNQIASYAVEVDLSNPTTSIIASYKDYNGAKLGFQKVRDQAYAVEAKRDVNVVAGINADFFNMQTGEPYGALVMEGTTHHSASGRPYFGITKDRKAVISTGKITDNILEAVGGICLLVENGEVTEDALTHDLGLTTAPRTAVGIKADGSVVLYVADGRQPPYSAGQYFHELARTLAALGCETALCLDGGGSTTYVSQHEGETDLVCRNRPSDGSERTVSSALLVCSTAKPSGVFHHASLSPNNEIFTPGSTVAFEAIGVDSSGYSAELPEDGAFALQDDSFGTITADGIFTSNGKTGEVVVNYISDGAVCGTVTVEVQIPDELYVANTEQAVGPLATTDFGIVAKYKDRAVTLKADDIKWTIKDQETDKNLDGIAGTFNGITFTATDDDAYNVIITAKLVCNEAIAPLSLTVFIGSKQSMLYDFEYVTGEENKDADNYIPSYSLPINGAAWLTANGYNGYRNRSEEIREEGYPLFMWPNAAVANDTVLAEIVSAEDGEPVRFGDKALRITFDNSSFNQSSNANFYLRATTPSYAFEGSPTAIGVWVYAPEGTSNYLLYLNCASQMSGDNIEKGIGHTVQSYQCLTGTDGINWTGWKYLEFDLTDGTIYGSSNVSDGHQPYGMNAGAGVFWISYQPANMGKPTADTIYIDDITLIYGANTSDTHNPKVNYIGDVNNGIVDGETVYTSNVNSFKAIYADVEDKYMTGINDEATKMYIDGVDVTDKCFINAGDDEIYFYDAVLADGVHNIEIEVSDNFGNKTTEMRYFTIDSNSDDTEVTLTAKNGAPVLGKDYVLTVESNFVSDITSADITVKVLSDYTSYWRNVTVEPSANYELEGEAVYNSITDTVSFKVVRKADAASSDDDGTIAKIITAVPSNTPEELNVTHRIAKGELTYASEKEANYVNGFSAKISENCAAAFSITTDVMTVGAAGGNIYIKDVDGLPAEGVNVYTADDKLLGTTNAEGKVFTDKFVSAVVSFSLYATRGEERSFIFKSQSFNAGGDETGLPTNVILNASADPATQQNISWMASPVAAADKAIVKYATKADYEKNGEAAFVEFTGISNLDTAAASGNIATNYAVRFNSAVITGLAPKTDYVYIVGDGTNWSELKNFSTDAKGKDTSFFIFGDTQDEDTSNVIAITSQLALSGVKYNFGIQTGDAVDNAGSYAYWNGIGEVFSGDFIGETDIIHVLGNHEYTGDAAGINAAHYFNLPGTTDKAPLAYSFEYGNVYIAAFTYLLGSDVEEAAQWLVEDAAKSTATWKILTMHQPIYFTNAGGGTSREMMDVLANAVDEANIDFVFAGHDHSYARTYPLTNGVKTEGGTVYFICAATSPDKTYTITDYPEFHEIATDEYNSIYLTVNTTDTTFDITAWNYDGTDHNVFDSYSVTKEINCTANGLHDYKLVDGELICNVCGYTTNNVGYTGWVKDSATGGNMYLIGGTVQTGWITIGEDHYYANEKGVTQTGSIKLDGHTYTFGADGKMTKGSLERNLDGTYTYYINGEKQRGWFLIDGEWYYFSRTNGYKTYRGTQTINGLTYRFSLSGYVTEGAWNETAQGTCYYWGPDPVLGLQEIDNFQYYFDPADTYMLVNESVEIDGQIYAFGSDGRFKHFEAHEDNDNDGKCDRCADRPFFTTFFENIINFFNSIIDFFRNIFNF